MFVSDSLITHRQLNELEHSKSNAQLLHLPEITGGVDSFELRIWHWSFAGGTSLTNLRFIKGKWLGHRTQYFSSNGNVDSCFTVAIPIPENISQIVKYLTSDSILQLPSQQAIPDFVDNVGDGQSVQLEISTASFYKTLNYHCPEHYTDKYNINF